MSKIYLYFNELSIVQMLVCITFELFHCFAPCLRASFFITALGQIEDFFWCHCLLFTKLVYAPAIHIHWRKENCSSVSCIHFSNVFVKFNCRYAFVYFAQKDEAVAALEKLKGTKIGDKRLKITPKQQKGKAKQQDNFVGEKFIVSVEGTAPSSFLRV